MATLNIGHPASEHENMASGSGVKRQECHITNNQIIPQVLEKRSPLNCIKTDQSKYLRKETPRCQGAVT